MSKKQDTIVTRMGDGERVSMSVQEVEKELLEGTQDAAKKAGIPELTADELQQMLEIFAEPGRIVSVPAGEEIIVTDELEIYTFEISARIVAGSNVGIGNSPYTYLNYGEGMYTGRRIAREIRSAINNDELEKVID